MRLVLTEKASVAQSIAQGIHPKYLRDGGVIHEQN